MLHLTPATICTPCYCITVVVRQKAISPEKWAKKKKKKKWSRLVQKWLCIAILHVDMQMGFKKKKTLVFWLWKIENGWGKKIKRLFNFCRLLDSLFGTMWTEWWGGGGGRAADSSAQTGTSQSASNTTSPLHAARRQNLHRNNSNWHWREATG